MPHCVFPRSGGGKAEYHAAVLNDKIGLPDRSADRFCVFWQNAVKYRAEWQVIVTLRWDDLRIVQRLFLADCFQSIFFTFRQAPDEVSQHNLNFARSAI